MPDDTKAAGTTPVRCQQRPVEAMQYDGANFDAIAGWVHAKGGMCAQMLGQPRINVGTGWAEAGDWIICGPFGFTYVTHVCFGNHYDVLAEGDVSSGTGLIAAERKRQIEAEGYTAEHDAQHETGELARAGAASALFAGRNEVLAERVWPFERAGFKPVRTDSWDATGSLVKAGALIAAAIDRLAEVSE